MSVQTELQIVFEDDQLIAVNKSWSDVVQPDRAGSVTLLDRLRVHLGTPPGARAGAAGQGPAGGPGTVFLGLVHRLDRPTSGVVLFARSRRMLVRLNELFRTRGVRKIYWAVVAAAPPLPAGRLVHYLSRNEALNKSFAADQARPGARKAELVYRHLASSEHYHLLEIGMRTGRHHQIRSQLAAVGCPIKGDLKYGARRSNPRGGIHLHARSLSFLHPLDGRRVTITAPPPADPLWDYFQGILEKSLDPGT